MEEALAREAPVAIAIVDTHGLLRACIRMPGAVPVAQDLVSKQARTAADFGALALEMDPALAERLVATAADFTDVPGGLPIVAYDTVVGGIAVSGGSADDDRAIAKAGLDVLT